MWPSTPSRTMAGSCHAEREPTMIQPHLTSIRSTDPEPATADLHDGPRPVLVLLRGGRAEAPGHQIGQFGSGVDAALQDRLPAPGLPGTTG